MSSERARETASNFEAAARRLARTGESDDSLQSLGVASMVLTSPSEPPRKDKPEDSAQSEATQAIINAIVDGGSNPPPQ